MNKKLYVHIIAAKAVNDLTAAEPAVTAASK